MSALMAERRDWAEDPRQASLFDALARPPEREAPQEPQREDARIVDFPKRRETAPEADQLDLTTTPGIEGAAYAPDAAGSPAPEAATVIEVLGPSAPDAAVPATAPDAAAMVDAPAAFGTSPAVAGGSAIEAEVVVAPEDLIGKACAPRAAGSPLARPTLDDVMSRVWEGLSTGLPAACPVCAGEMSPATPGPRSGRCASCGSAMD